MQSTNRAYMLGSEEGEPIWFAGTLMLLKAAADETSGQFALLDQRVPPGYAAPRHLHRGEDEAWYLLEGDATFYCDDSQFAAGPGAWVFLPKAIPHAFRAGPAGARLLTFSAPAGFADFVRAAGEPAPGLTLPPPGPMDVPRLEALARRYGIEILGPPPA